MSPFLVEMVPRTPFSESNKSRISWISKAQSRGSLKMNTASILRCGGWEVKGSEISRKGVVGGVLVGVAMGLGSPCAVEA